MLAKLLCLSASVLVSVVGGCGQTAEKGSKDMAGAAQGVSVADVALEIALNQFPGGYQARWAQDAADCAEDPESSATGMSLQGRLIKLPQSIGTMVQGKRMTSKTMEAQFEFVGKAGKWRQAMAFELSEDRAQLSRMDLADGLRTRYVRCPKLMAG